VNAASGFEGLLRELTPQVIGILVHRFGDFASCEDAVQEALLAAAVQWPAEGIPANPKGWLITVASRRRTELWRSDSARRRREQTAAALTPADPGPVPAIDDTLTLLLLCCHPSLSPSAQVALTLRAVGGLTTAEIARALLVPEATVGQRISRAKQRIKSSGAEFRMPAAAEFPERITAALRVLYLIFNEGYTGRVDLAAEAIRLARQLVLECDEPEVGGLLALMLLHHARQPARIDAHGALVSLDYQDRALWNSKEIAEGVRILQAALAKDRRGEYQIQAAIAALHDDAPTAAQTDWPQILAWYDELVTLTGNPAAALSRAVAVGEVDGPLAGLQATEGLDARLPGYHRLDAVRAHLHERAGHRDIAAELYAHAAARSRSTLERDHLAKRAARLRRG
jgi:RNA polymerase sigma factor (sigma-70 family)